MTVSAIILSTIITALVITVFLRIIVRKQLIGKRNIIFGVLIALLLCIFPWTFSYVYFNYTSGGIEKRLAEEARKSPIHERISIYDNGILIREYEGYFILTRDDTTYILDEDGKIRSFTGGVVIVEPITEEDEQ